MFKVGDLIIGNDKNNYGITAEGVVCIVEEVCPNKNKPINNEIFVYTYDKQSKQRSKREGYWVFERYFDPYHALAVELL